MPISTSGRSSLRFSSLTCVHGDLHRHGAGDRALGVVLLPDRRAEQHEDRVADELVDGALILLDDRAPWWRDSD